MSRFSPGNKSFWLSQLYESNYRKLRQMVPALEQLQTDEVAASSGNPALRLTVIERSPYTLTVELRPLYSGNQAQPDDPRLRIRVYLDGKCAEALGSLESDEPTDRGAGTPLEMLETKWTINYFLARWLEHCLRKRCRFDDQQNLTEAAELA